MLFADFIIVCKDRRREFWKVQLLRVPVEPTQDIFFNQNTQVISINEYLTQMFVMTSRHSRCVFCNVLFLDDASFENINNLNQNIVSFGHVR